MIEQAIIAICGALSIWCVSSPHARTRGWGAIIGLCAQPFWLYATWQSEQWGMFTLSLIYTAGWARGVHTYWGTA